MTTCSSAAYGTRHRRGGAAPDGAPSSAIRIHAIVPAPHSHVAKCSIFVARGPGGLLPFATSSSLTRRRRPRTHSRTHPQHARTHRHRTTISCAHAPTHVRTHSTLGLTVIANDQSLRFLPFMHGPPRCSHHPQISRHARRLSSSSSGFPPFSWPAVLFFLFASRCVGCSLFLLAFALRRAPRLPATKNQLASAHTDDRRTDDATSGPQAWLTGRLHEGGTRSVRSPPRRPPLLATPIAKPLQCGRP